MKAGGDRVSARVDILVGPERRLLGHRLEKVREGGGVRACGPRLGLHFSLHGAE